jgi:TonB family protein
MPNTPIQPASPATTERRRRERVQPSGLVYLDIGTENGGIVLDLNEVGAGVQAVAPLAALSKISIRFQLPGSAKRSQTEAQVAWVSESRRRVGLHFLDVPDEVRAQLRDWLASQSPASAEERLAESARFAHPQFDTAPPGAPREKWLRLSSEGSPTPNLPGTPVLSETHAEASIEALAAQRDSLGVPSQKSTRETALEYRSDLHETTALEEANPPPAGSEQGSIDENAIGAHSHRLERADVIDWPASAATTDSEAEPAALRGAAIPVQRPSAPFVEKLLEPRQLTGRLTARNRGGSWKIAIAVVILLAASFEAGRWLGNVRAPFTRPGSTRVPVRQVESKAEKPPAPVTTRERRAPGFRHRRSENTEPVARQVGASDPNLTAAPLPVEPNITAPPSPPVMPRSSGPPVDTARAIQASPPPPAAQTGGSVQAPATTTIDGRVLAATDRFNPAHLLYHFAPDYPAEAKQQHVEGTVMVRVSIDASGAVDHVQVLSGPPLLVPAAVSAVKSWRYLPALLNGEPVRSEQDVSVDFRVPSAEQ